MTDAEILKAVNRSIWLRRMFVGVALDVVLVALAVYFFAGEEDRSLVTVAIGVVALWVVQSILTFKNFLLGLVSIKFFEGSLLQKNFLGILRTNKIPVPGLHSQTFNYLSELADDEDRPADERVRVAVLYTMWSTVMRLRGIVVTLIMTDAWDKAIQQYADERPGQ